MLLRRIPWRACRAVRNTAQLLHTVDSSKPVATLEEQSDEWDELRRPDQPDQEACCQVRLNLWVLDHDTTITHHQRGCATCVWDLYHEELRAYEAKRAARTGKPPPEDPFAAMERRLAEQAQAQAQQGR